MVIKQHFRINLAVPGIGRCFVQDRGEVIHIWRKAGTDAWYIERDIDELFLRKEGEDYPQQGTRAQLPKGEDWIIELVVKRSSAGWPSPGFFMHSKGISQFCVNAY